MQQKIKNIIKFLNDLEALKSELRHSWMSSGRQESVAEHSWRCAVMALVLALEFPEVNIIKVIKMCLIHKAAGWMLREVCKIDQLAEEKFLLKYYQKMPRTMLRYAIEKFSKRQRSFYLK